MAPSELTHWAVTPGIYLTYSLSYLSKVWSETSACFLNAVSVLFMRKLTQLQLPLSIPHQKTPA